MARREAHPAWSQIGIPIVQWLALTGVLVMLALILTGGDNPPTLLKKPNGLGKAGESSPFSLAALHKRLPPKGIERIQHFINYYRENRRRGLADALGRSTRYLDTFKGIFREAGLPEELAYLPLIESGFMEHAVSPARAVGVWQFIEETGRRYDLKSTRWFDQKRDPIHSARAAAKYLKHLHDRFGDWELALAAYNSGEGTIYWTGRANEKAGLPTDFWSLDLPDETRAYVPAFLAAMLIAKNPSAYGFDEIEFEPKVVFEQVKVNPGVPLHAVAEQIDIDVDLLFELNPELVAGVTPPGDEHYPLRVPSGKREQLARKVAQWSKDHPDWMLHQVRARDTVTRLATLYRTSATDIRKLNRLDSDTPLTPGKFVIIPL